MDCQSHRSVVRSLRLRGRFGLGLDVLEGAGQHLTVTEGQDQGGAIPRHG